MPLIIFFLIQPGLLEIKLKDPIIVIFLCKQYCIYTCPKCLYNLTSWIYLMVYLTLFHWVKFKIDSNCFGLTRILSRQTGVKIKYTDYVDKFTFYIIILYVTVNQLG